MMHASSLYFLLWTVLAPAISAGAYVEVATKAVACFVWGQSRLWSPTGESARLTTCTVSQNIKYSRSIYCSMYYASICVWIYICRLFAQVGWVGLRTTTNLAPYGVRLLRVQCLTSPRKMRWLPRHGLSVRVSVERAGGAATAGLCGHAFVCIQIFLHAAFVASRFPYIHIVMIPSHPIPDRMYHRTRERRAHDTRIAQMRSV